MTIDEIMDRPELLPDSKVSRAELRAAITQLLRDERERCMQAVSNEYVGGGLNDEDLPDGDLCYNRALRHAVEAIRQMKG